MPKSPAFIRIKAQVLDIVRAIPAGRATSFQAIGAYLDVMPRHVAYILATLTDAERASVPWHRVVSESGEVLKSRQPDVRERQIALLADDGIAVAPDGKVRTFGDLFFPIDERSTGVHVLPRV